MEIHEIQIEYYLKRKLRQIIESKFLPLPPSPPLSPHETLRGGRENDSQKNSQHFDFCYKLLLSVYSVYEAVVVLVVVVEVVVVVVVVARGY